MGQDRALELLQGTPRLKAEPVQQFTPSVLISLERVGLPTRAVQREHQLSAKALAQRMLADQRLELAHQPRVLARREVRVDPVLEHDQTSLLEPRGLRLGERLVGEIAQRGTPPHRECLAQNSGRRQRVAVLERPPPLRRQPLEPVDIGLPRLDPEHVAAACVTSRPSPSTLRRFDTYP